MTSTSRHTKSQGFALLLAIIIASVVLSIGISILNTSVNQLSLSSTARESELAFQSAQTMMDCLRYWRYEKADEYTAEPAGGTGTTFDPPTAVCFGEDSIEAEGEVIENGSDGYITTHSYVFEWGSPLRCTSAQMSVMVPEAPSGGTAVTGTFEGNQGPWEDLWNDALPPTFVTNVESGDTIKMISSAGTWSCRISGGTDICSRQCSQGTLSFTDSSDNQISKVILSDTTDGHSVPAGATRAYVSVDDSSGAYFDNSGNRDSRAACSVTLALNADSGTGMTHTFAGASVGDDGDGQKTCDAGSTCTVLFSQGYNRPCDELDTSIFAVQRELTIEF